MKEVEVIKVVRTYLMRRGKGVPGSPVRIIEQFWSLDGTLLAENDPLQNEPGVMGYTDNPSLK